MGKVLIKDAGGVVRTLTGPGGGKVMVKDAGGVVRTLSSAGPGKLLLKDAGGVVRTLTLEAPSQIVWTTDPWPLTQIGAGTQKGTIRMRDNGVGEILDSVDVPDDAENWHEDAPAPANAADYEVEVTWDIAPDSGPSGFQGLGSTTEWVWTQPFPGTKNVTGTIEVREIADTGNSVTKPFTMQLQPTS